MEECQDPVSVEVHYDSYYPDYVEFQYVYNQSEIVDNYGQGDTGRYSGILARNASHLGFEVKLLEAIIYSTFRRLGLVGSLRSPIMR